MPTYDYKCTVCKWEGEIFHSIKLGPKSQKCPKCGAKKLKRLISTDTGQNIIFKGEGFYRTTDYINQKAKEEGMIHDDKKKVRRESL
jgi:putative FmdB family regulatory protein